ncbi:hypothetical protein [Prosthecomicrobium sp. N25]|uniref:hypothetical protein n=1 Tax=Prosthecomicrobium sp. N25 TaxID=3129254 RepID=UPI0030789057
MIEVEPGLNLRFPRRSAEFLEGVEIGILAATLASAGADVVRPVGRTALEQARDLAAGLGFAAIEQADLGDRVLVCFTKRRRRQHLRLVSCPD